jgi:hypothetical protein
VLVFVAFFAVFLALFFVALFFVARFLVTAFLVAAFLVAALFARLSRARNHCWADLSIVSLSRRP